MNNIDLRQLTRAQFQKLINDCILGRDRSLDAARTFIEADAPVKRYVIGQNKQSEDLIQHFKMDGIIFDGDPGEATSWHGLPFIESKDVPRGSLVANCSTSICPVDVLRRLSSLGLTVANIGDIIFELDGLIEWPWFVSQHRESIRSNFEDWWKIYSGFDDEYSREVLMETLLYKLTADINFMLGYDVRLSDQYLESFMNYKNEIFVDAGGFDGDTTEEFCRHYPDYERILFFEPSSKNMANAKYRLKDLRNIKYFEVGLSDAKGTLKFNSEAGSASAVSSFGDTTIVVDSLDDLVEDAVSTIKMDLEGWELIALKGCASTIRTHRPKLAISVYHAANDFIDIPKYIRSIQPDYKVRLRHYTQGWSESVMFFF